MEYEIGTRIDRLEQSITELIRLEKVLWLANRKETVGKKVEEVLLEEFPEFKEKKEVKEDVPNN